MHRLIDAKCDRCGVTTEHKVTWQRGLPDTEMHRTPGWIRTIVYGTGAPMILELCAACSPDVLAALTPVGAL